MADVPHPTHRGGLTAALMAPIFLGMAPVLGKLAYLGGSGPFTVAATRTVVGVVVLWAVYLLFGRRYIYIYPVGLLGCVVVGAVNGIGSLFYYNGLNYLNASMVQLLNATYLVFVAILARLGGPPLTARTLIRATPALFALALLTGGIAVENSWLLGVFLRSKRFLFAGILL